MKSENYCFGWEVNLQSTPENVRNETGPLERGVLSENNGEYDCSRIGFDSLPVKWPGFTTKFTGTSREFDSNTKPYLFDFVHRSLFYSAVRFDLNSRLTVFLFISMQIQDSFWTSILPRRFGYCHLVDRMF